jgi:hypothetical protein
VSITPEGVDEFRRHYGFDDWREPQPGGTALFIWRFALGGLELTGYEPLRIDNVELPDVPPTIQSLWRPSNEEAAGVLLRVDVSEAPSVLDARALLLRTLGEFQSPQIERISDGPGDVAFGGRDHRVLVYSRANVVVMVRNAGDEVKSVEAPARELDQLLRDGPGPDRSSVRPAITRAEAEPATVSGHRQFRLALDAEDPLGRHVWFRFSARSGEFVAQGDGVVFRPAGDGKQAILITAVNENLGVTIEQVEFTV